MSNRWYYKEHEIHLKHISKNKKEVYVDGDPTGIIGEDREDLNLEAMQYVDKLHCETND